MVDVINSKSVEGEAKIREIETRVGTKLKVFYGPEDVADVDYKRDIGNAAEFPYVRSFYPPVPPPAPARTGSLIFSPIWEWARPGIPGRGLNICVNSGLKT